MSRFCPLFSSSSGNCTYIGSRDCGILVDAGSSCKSILCALEYREISPNSIKAIAVTHEHSDHIKGLKTLLKKLSVPVIASPVTLSALRSAGAISENSEVLAVESGVKMDGMLISRFATSHDCEGSSGYKVLLPDGRSTAVCTDLGYINEEIKKQLLGCDLVMLESNHDINMLRNGPYPFALKERILSDRGHLSNTQCAEMLPNLVKSGTTRLILAHLSRHNNLPTLAMSAARAGLVEAGLKEELDYMLYVAPTEGGKMFIL